MIAALDDVVRKAARKFGVSAYEIAVASISVWGQSLTEERDARLAAESKTGEQRALRGWITRKLLDELKERIEQSRDRKGRARRHRRR